MRSAMLCICCGLFASPALAQAVQRVAVEVTAVSGNSVYVSQGRAAHIEPGDTLVLFPPGAEPVQARIQSVSRTSARGELPEGAAAVGPGVPGEVLVPEQRFNAKAGDGAPPAEPPSAQPREHPPWTQPLGDWQDDKPLLAPAFGQGAAARPTRIGGRVFTQALHTWDGGIDDRRYLFGRLGTDLRIDNPFHEGGRLRLAGELTRRESHADDDDVSSRGRLDRASYAWGDEALAPVRVEAGRFMPSEFPELGLIDGLEAHLPVANGASRLGASIGAFPEPFPSRATGDDTQASLFYRFRSDDEDERYVAGVALQKTWHRGTADRDLLFADLSLRPVDALSIYSSAWVDYYGSGDSIKAHGLQLTEFHLHGSYRLTDDHGFGVHTSQIRWPELKRAEFRALPADQIRDNRNSRAGVNAWHRFGDHVRLDERFDVWQDQDQDGLSANVRLSLREVLYARGDVSADLFRADGAFSDGFGLRLAAARAFDGGNYGRLGFEWSRFDQDQFNAPDRDLDLMAITSQIDLRLAPSVDLTLNADYRFGDGQNAFTLGFFSQVRF